MIDETGYGVLTDTQWAELAPLIEQCRPAHKTVHVNLRRTIEAIVWRHDNGAKWRSIPPHLGPWWMAAQTFNRWSRHGVWERLLQRAQQREGIKVGFRCKVRLSSQFATEKSHEPNALYVTHSVQKQTLQRNRISIA